MSAQIKMPALGESVTEGTVTTWLKQVGDAVEADEPILEVSTDKVDTEVPAPAAGVLESIEVGEDETVAVGTVLGYIGDGSSSSDEQSVPDCAQNTSSPAPGETAPVCAPAPVPAETASAPDTHPQQPSYASSALPAAGTDCTAYVTPVVRRLAKELNVDLSGITGTGVGGRIRRQDVKAAADAARQAAREKAEAALGTPAPSVHTSSCAAGSVKAELADKAAAAAALRGTRQKMTGLRKTIAKRMTESLQTSAQLTTVMEVDVTRIVALRAKAKDSFAAREGVKLTYLPFFVKAATEALKAHPIINSSVEENEIVYHSGQHIGIAVDSPKGLFVPVIRNAGDLNIAGISRAISDLAKRTRDGSISAGELSGSTFTVTNTGSVGALFDTPIINQPNVAILGTGAIFKAPGVVMDQDGNETISIRSKCFLAISYDHRIIDGADASRYLRDVKMRLEEADFGAEIGL